MIAFVTPLELESHGQRNVALLVECAGVVTELHVVAVDRLSPAVVCQQLADSKTSAMNMVLSLAGAGERKCRFCQTAPPTVLGIPT